MKILLVTLGYYPDKDAGSTRVTLFAKSLKNLGHEPTVVGYGTFNNYEAEKIDNINYIALFPRMRNFKKSITYILKNKIVEPDVIWIYWAPLTSFIFLKKYAIKHKIKLIHDSVEWFSTKNIKQKLSYFFIENNFINRYVLDKHFKIIAISSYLEKYFSNKKIETIRIPVLMDVHNIDHQKDYLNDNKIHFLYAGSPSHSKSSAKDDLKTILDVLLSLPEQYKNKISFTIIGITSKHVLDYYDINLNDLNIDIKALGRIQRNEVIKHYKQAHFSVLLRDAKARNSNAGFPTKVVESLSTGTPIVCNLTSDLSLYLENNVNAIIVENNNYDAFKKAIIELLNLDMNTIYNMSYNARQTAINNFEYNSYNSKIKNFLD